MQGELPKGDRLWDDGESECWKRLRTQKEAECRKAANAKAGKAVERQNLPWVAQSGHVRRGLPRAAIAAVCEKR